MHNNWVKILALTHGGIGTALVALSLAAPTYEPVDDDDE
jgi:hypothetical protein